MISSWLESAEFELTERSKLLMERLLKVSGGGAYSLFTEDSDDVEATSDVELAFTTFGMSAIDISHPPATVKYDGLSETKQLNQFQSDASNLLHKQFEYSKLLLYKFEAVY